MIVNIDSTYFFKVNEFSFDLMENITVTKKKTGEKVPGTKTIGHYTNIESLVNNVILKKLEKSEDVVTLKEFIIKFKEEKESMITNIKY